MWFKKKKADPVVTPKEETPKETTTKVIMEIVVVNNKTDKEYTIKSENNFGLKWDYVGKQPYELLMIQQKNNIDGSSWQAAARLVDFSIIKYNWKTVEIIKLV